MDLFFFLPFCFGDLDRGDSAPLSGDLDRGDLDFLLAGDSVFESSFLGVDATDALLVDLPRGVDSSAVGAAAGRGDDTTVAPLGLVRGVDAPRSRNMLFDISSFASLGSTFGETERRGDFFGDSLSTAFFFNNFNFFASSLATSSAATSSE
jgi:hypothetical protein